MLVYSINVKITLIVNNIKNLVFFFIFYSYMCMIWLIYEKEKSCAMQKIRESQRIEHI